MHINIIKSNHQAAAVKSPSDAEPGILTNIRGATDLVLRNSSLVLKQDLDINYVCTSKLSHE